MNRYSQVKVFIQPSTSRCFSNDEYANAGVEVCVNLSHCDWLLGVKEVDPLQLIEGKKYLFFSHTIKEQPFNQALIRAAISQKIDLIDYECLRNEAGRRLIGFGRFAGIVGAYNALLFFCRREGQSHLQRAYEQKSLPELYAHLAKFTLPKDLRIVVTGTGRVGSGVRELLQQTGLPFLTKEAYLHTMDGGVLVLGKEEFIVNDSGSFDSEEFGVQPFSHHSVLPIFLASADIYIAAHYWQGNQPKILTIDQLNHFERLQLISDISCDINGGVESTIRSCPIDRPFYYHQNDSNGVLITAIDNLPCEIPRAATRGFGQKMVNEILPMIIANEHNEVIRNATIVTKGQLGPSFQYLKSYAGL